MQVSCPRCSRVLEYSGDRPLFCAYCGQPLGPADSDPRLVLTAAFEPGSGLPAGLGLGSGPGAGSGAGSGGPSGETEAAVRRGPGPARSDEPDPDRVAGYTILRRLGRGGMGTVYEAEDRDLGRRVALKVIGADHVASPEAVERFRQEGRLASTISHPRCVFVLSADEHQGRPYIVMELMPGETLQTLVEQRGPLPTGEAVAKILDVIEGLREAHIQGVVHRDVKPSNCFLEAGGRVKVGDFGLSKSLDADAGLTRSGSFIGTPLYASPEQIKRDAVDARTDVYSAAATLYYLLTGRPPFEAGDAAATLAKIVSEPPAPMRRYVPGLPPALEAAVLRGLDRDRDRRWQDLGRFREALLPFVSTGLSLGDLALRVSAYLADFLLLAAAGWGTATVVFAALAPPKEAARLLLGRYSLWLLAARAVESVAYFAVCEGLWGASPGKRFTGLRVSREGEGGPPGVRRGALRALTFYALTGLPGEATTVLVFGLLPAGRAFLFEPLALVVRGVGLLAASATMRAGNGYRGLHELASGTRVVRLPHSARRRAPRGRRIPVRPERYQEGMARPVGVLQALGPFRVRGAVRWDGDRRVLLGEDPALGRPVWVVLRPKGSPPPPPARRDLGRPSRPRWLGGGEQAEGRWDAYAAPLGCPLADLAGKTGLPWADARPILHDLADELARAVAEGTLPGALAVDQVWIQPDGTVQLADPLGDSSVGAPDGDAGRALELLRRTAATALEGGRRRGGSAPVDAVRAAVPGHAARMLDRLIGRPRPGDAPYADVASVAADLEADRDKPTEVDLARRAVHLAPSAAVLAPVVLVLLALTYPGGPAWPAFASWLGLDGPPSHGLPAVGAATAAAVAWAALTRGGLLLGLAGMALVRADSRPAERWRCAWRALAAWLPVAALLAAADWARVQGWPSTAWLLWTLALVAVAFYPVLALVLPARSVHDRLAGTSLVPK